MDMYVYRHTPAISLRPLSGGTWRKNPKIEVQMHRKVHGRTINDFFNRFVRWPSHDHHLKREPDRLNIPEASSGPHDSGTYGAPQCGIGWTSDSGLCDLAHVVISVTYRMACTTCTCPCPVRTQTQPGVA